MPTRQEDGIYTSEVNKGKGKEMVVCIPQAGAGITPTCDGITMSPGHGGTPLPIKWQRKGQMFVPIDMVDNDG